MTVDETKDWDYQTKVFSFLIVYFEAVDLTVDLGKAPSWERMRVI